MANKMKNQGSKQRPLLASLIVTSYNQKKTLELLLASLCRQTNLQFEVIIADDGSSDQTQDLCQKDYPFSIIYLTQPDEGYRKSIILNQAIQKAQTSYLIFIDGDTLVEPHYVEDHLSLRKNEAFVCGRRIDLSDSLSRTITLNLVNSGFFDFFRWRVFFDSIFGETQGWKRSLRIKNLWLRKKMNYDLPIDILGSNFSAWKKDVLEVNGFNEEITQYWGEDGDIYIRLRNSGKKAINAKGMCIQYHIFHTRREAHPDSEKNYQLQLKDLSYKWARKGIIK